MRLVISVLSCTVMAHSGKTSGRLRPPHCTYPQQGGKKDSSRIKTLDFRKADFNTLKEVFRFP